jgi:hypothetical protein
MNAQTARTKILEIDGERALGAVDDDRRPGGDS